MRYTLRLLTLDQLTRAAGVICALELMRDEPAWKEGARRTLGDWPIEIGLWVGSAATPNRLGKRGDGKSDTAIGSYQAVSQPSGASPSPDQGMPVVLGAVLGRQLSVHAE